MPVRAVLAVAMPTAGDSTRGWYAQGLSLLLVLSMAVLRAPGVSAQQVQVQVAGDEPVVLAEAPGFHRAHTDAEQAPIYSDNLQVDFRPWMGQKYSVQMLYELMTTLVKGRPQKYLSAVILKGGNVTVLPLATRPMKLTINRMRAIAEGLRNGTTSGLAYPDTIYLMNVWDEGRCYNESAAAAADAAEAARVLRAGGKPKKPRPRHQRKLAPCTVPVFSLIKSWDYEVNVSAEVDVLLPFFNHIYENLVFFPWERKLDKALMRAALQEQMRRNATRLWILELQKSNPEGQRLLDAGITNNLSKRIKAQLANFVNIADHARYKYLLSADGFTASCRLGKLMGTNSVVLKETTPWIEYYYRSLKPDVHFVPFHKDNVLEVIKALEADPARAQKVSAAAQQFTYTYLSQHAKAMYVRRAMQTYNGLFSDMDAFMAQLDMASAGAGLADAAATGGTSGNGMTLMGLLAQMKAYVERASGQGAKAG